MNKAEQNYSTTEREALALVEGVKKFQPYLHNCNSTVGTDHSSLRWLMNVKNASGRLARWALLLQQYDFNIVHRPGRIHGNADCLSRRRYDFCEMSLLKKEEPQTHHTREMQRRDLELPREKFIDSLGHQVLGLPPPAHQVYQKNVLSLQPKYVSMSFTPSFQNNFLNALLFLYILTVV